MQLTAFIIPAEAVAERLAQLQASFAASGRPGTFEDNALRVIGDRMARHPQQYLEFGPYWWAVKAALNASDFSFGEHFDPLVAAAYTCGSTAETLVAAEAFKDFYRRSYFVGHNTYDLAGDGEQYRLEDPDMMERIPVRA